MDITKSYNGFLIEVGGLSLRRISPNSEREK